MYLVEQQFLSLFTADVKSFHFTCGGFTVYVMKLCRFSFASRLNAQIPKWKRYFCLLDRMSFERLSLGMFLKELLTQNRKVSYYLLTLLSFKAPFHKEKVFKLSPKSDCMIPFLKYKIRCTFQCVKTHTV